MAFSLDFSPEFFMLPGELYDGAEYPHGDTPYSVIGAIRAMSDEEYEEMSQEVFGCSSDYVDVDTVITKIRETDTCGDLRSPVDVWIDEGGYWTVSVYERGDRPDL